MTGGSSVGVAPKAESRHLQALGPMFVLDVEDPLQVSQG